MDEMTFTSAVWATLLAASLHHSDSFPQVSHNK